MENSPQAGRPSFTVSAYVPMYNNRATVGAAVRSLLEQAVVPDEIFVVDDGSSDDCAQLVEGLGVRVVRQPENLGRGAARARAMLEAKGELVLCCDATKGLEPDFLRQALRWFDDPRVAAVYGRIYQPPPRGAGERWRGRHLFMLDVAFAVDRRAPLITSGALMRRSAVLATGNYNSLLRHSEDQDLGARLLAAGFDVVFDPGLRLFENAHNTLRQVLERYWRYYAGQTETCSWRDYLKNQAYAAKVMAVQDLRAGDFPGALISLFSPHYRFWRSWSRARHRKGIPAMARPGAR